VRGHVCAFESGDMSPPSKSEIVRKNLPVRFCGASVASQTIVFAPSSTERVAFRPPRSVRTQPGQTEFTAAFGNAAASCDVTPLSAVFEMQ